MGTLPMCTLIYVEKYSVNYIYVPRLGRQARKPLWLDCSCNRITLLLLLLYSDLPPPGFYTFDLHGEMCVWDGKGLITTKAHAERVHCGPAGENESADGRVKMRVYIPSFVYMCTYVSVCTYKRLCRRLFSWRWWCYTWKWLLLPSYNNALFVSVYNCVVISPFLDWTLLIYFHVRDPFHFWSWRRWNMDVLSAIHN